MPIGRKTTSKVINKTENNIKSNKQNNSYNWRRRDANWCQVVAGEIKCVENWPIGIYSSPVIVVVILFITFDGYCSILTAFGRSQDRVQAVRWNFPDKSLGIYLAACTHEELNMTFSTNS